VGELHWTNMKCSKKSWWQCPRVSKDFWMVFSIQTLGNFSWCLWAFRLSHHRLHRQKGGEISLNHQQRSMKYHFGDSWQV